MTETISSRGKCFKSASSQASFIHMTYFTWISFPRLQFRLFYDVTSTLCKVLQSNMLLLRITVLDTVTRQTVMSLCSFFCRTWKFDQRWTHIYSCTHTTISWLQFPRGEMKAWSAVSEERRYELWFLLFKRTRRQIANRCVCVFFRIKICVSV